MQQIIKEIESYLKDDIILKIRNKEHTANIDAEILDKEQLENGDWLKNAYEITIVHKDDNYLWDKWGHIDLDYLLKRTIDYFKKAKKSKNGFQHLKRFLR